jgi:hypothetical protein
MEFELFKVKYKLLFSRREKETRERKSYKRLQEVNTKNNRIILSLISFYLILSKGYKRLKEVNTKNNMKSNNVKTSKRSGPPTMVIRN